MPVVKKQSPFPDHEELRVKNSTSDMIVDLVSLSAGLDMAIASIKDGQITKAARQGLRDLLGQTYLLYSRKMALAILRDEECVKKDTELASVSIHFDLPDESHDDLLIYYKVSS